ncbi:MAG: hypothetical protein AAF585_22380, partial [Verrucomicrobiota bacterium]
MNAERRSFQSFEIPDSAEFSADMPMEPSSSPRLPAATTAPAPAAAAQPAADDLHWAFVDSDPAQPAAPGGMGGAGGGGIPLAQSGQSLGGGGAAPSGGGGDAFAVADVGARLRVRPTEVSDLTREGDIQVSAGRDLSVAEYEYAGRQVGGKASGSNSLEFGGSEFRDTANLLATPQSGSAATGISRGSVQIGNGEGSALGLKLEGEKSNAIIEERLMEEAEEDEAMPADAFAEIAPKADVEFAETESLRLDYGIPIDGKKLADDSGRMNFSLGFQTDEQDADKAKGLRSIDEIQELDRQIAPEQKPMEMAKVDPIQPRFGFAGAAMESAEAPVLDPEPLPEPEPAPTSPSNASGGVDQNLANRAQHLGDVNGGIAARPIVDEEVSKKSASKLEANLSAMRSELAASGEDNEDDARNAPAKPGQSIVVAGVVVDSDDDGIAVDSPDGGDGELGGAVRMRREELGAERKSRDFSLSSAGAASGGQQLQENTEMLKELGDIRKGGQGQSLAEFSAPSREVKTPVPAPKVTTATSESVRGKALNKQLDRLADKNGEVSDEHRWVSGEETETSDEKAREWHRTPNQPPKSDVVADQFGTEYLQEPMPNGVVEINITGNNRTKDQVVRRDLAIEPEELYRAQPANESKRKLNKAADFSEVDISVPPSPADGMELAQQVESKPISESEPQPEAETPSSFRRSVSNFFRSFGRPSREEEAETPPPPATLQPSARPMPGHGQVAALGPIEEERETAADKRQLAEANSDLSVPLYKWGTKQFGEDANEFESKLSEEETRRFLNRYETAPRTPGEIIVNVENGSYILNGQTLSPDQLKTRLAKVENTFPNQPLIVREDGRATLMNFEDFEVFERDMLGGAKNLRGFDFRAISPVEFPELQAAVEPTST